jgi:hypothetical protein
MQYSDLFQIRPVVRVEGYDETMAGLTKFFGTIEKKVQCDTCIDLQPSPSWILDAPSLSSNLSRYTGEGEDRARVIPARW